MNSSLLPTIVSYFMKLFYLVLTATCGRSFYYPILFKRLRFIEVKHLPTVPNNRGGVEPGFKTCVRLQSRTISLYLIISLEGGALPSFFF